MSQDGDGQNPRDYLVGRGRPPTQHQFKKGQSGNGKGRPRRLGRSLTSRQFRRDILEVAEMPTTIQTPNGPRKVTIGQALIWKTVLRATKDHGPSLRLFMNWYTAALLGHEAAHEEFRFLEWMEAENTMRPEKHQSATDQKMLAVARKKTRKP